MNLKETTQTRTKKYLKQEPKTLFLIASLSQSNKTKKITKG